MKVRYIGVLAALLILDLVWWAYGRQWIETLLTGQAWPPFQQLAQTIYPRLLTEKARLSTDFFVEKTNQVVLRLHLTIAFVVLVTYPWGQRASLLQRLHRWVIQQACTITQVRFLRIAYISIILYYGRDFYFDLAPLSQLNAFYEPIFPLSLFAFPWPGQSGLLALWLVFWAAGMLALVGYRPVLTTSITVVAFLIQNALFQSFGKMWHPYATLEIAGLLMPWLLWEAGKQTNHFVKAWPLTYIQLSIAASYFLSGIEKLLTSGEVWWNGATLQRQAVVLAQQQTVALFGVPESLWWVGSLAVLAFQLSFPLALYRPKYQYIFLIGGMAFHWGTWWFLGVGTFFHPWIVSYVFLLVKTTNQHLEQTDKFPITTGKDIGK